MLIDENTTVNVVLKSEQNTMILKKQNTLHPKNYFKHQREYCKTWLQANWCIKYWIEVWYSHTYSMYLLAASLREGTMPVQLKGRLHGTQIKSCFMHLLQLRLRWTHTKLVWQLSSLIIALLYPKILKKNLKSYNFL